MLAADKARDQRFIVTRKHVVITGGHGGLARAIAVEFTQWYEVAAPGREELDVCSEACVDRYFERHKPELLVCCAGLVEDTLLAHGDGSDWERVWSANLTGARCCANAALRGMRIRQTGHIVLISSHSALKPAPGQAVYAAAKRALLGLTLDLAKRHGGDNLRVNAVLPGFLESRMTADVSQKRRQAILDDHSLGRFNTMDRVARFVRFLHEELPHTSGQWFQLDSRETMA